MATRAVTGVEIRQAMCAAWTAHSEQRAEHLHVRELGDGRAVYLQSIGWGNLRLGIGLVASECYLDVWQYQIDRTIEAWRAALGWDGEGEPEGWYRHYRTGRRRPGGDASKEYIHW